MWTLKTLADGVGDVAVFDDDAPTTTHPTTTTSVVNRTTNATIDADTANARARPVSDWPIIISRIATCRIDVHIIAHISTY